MRGEVIESKREKLSRNGANYLTRSFTVFPRFEAFTVLNVGIIVFWDVKPCNLLGGQVYKCFAGTCLPVLKNLSSQMNELLAQVTSSKK